MLLFFEFIIVHPMITLASIVFVGRKQTALLICEVQGNPTPVISWSPCHGKYVVCDKRYLSISKVQTARANYTCTATNALGVDSATTLLRKWTLRYTLTFTAIPFEWGRKADQNCIDEARASQAPGWRTHLHTLDIPVMSPHVEGEGAANGKLLNEKGCTSNPIRALCSMSD